MKRKPPPTPEIWRDCTAFPGYQVSDRGNVRSVDRQITTIRGQTRALRGRPLRLHPNDDGYLVARLSIGGVTWHKLVHILVAYAFIGDPICENAQVHHANRKRCDNRLCNLSWQSGTEHLAVHFTGENNPAAKLTEQQIEEVKRLLRQGASQRQVARQFQINQSNVSRLNAGITWRHLYSPPATPPQLSLFLDFELTELVELEF